MIIIRQIPSFALFTPTLLSCEKLRVEIIERESNNAKVTTRHTLKIRAFLGGRERRRRTQCDARIGNHVIFHRSHLPSEFHELIQSIASFSSVYVLQRGFGKTFVDVRVDALVGPFIWKRHATNATRFATASRLSLLRLLRFILRHVKK